MSKKQDGTWKLQKGIDVALVTAVTQELHARMINSTAAGPPQHASAPPAPTNVSIPPPPPLPPGAQIPVPLPPPGATPPPPVYDAAGNLSAPVPVPQSVDVGVRDAAQPGMVQPVGSPFRDLIAKITAARNAGKLTADEVTSLVMQAGAPSLQLLGSMSHLVPVVDSYIDAVLITR